MTSKPGLIEQNIPSFYDDLKRSFDHAWALLAKGVKDRRSAFHTPVLITADAEDLFDFRTVVLRGTMKEDALLRFHTDRRSSKFGQLSRNPECGIHIYDRSAKIQLRMKGRANLRFNDEMAKSCWERSQPGSQVCYSQKNTPGSRMADPKDIEFQPEGADDNFCVIQVSVDRLQWLYLAHTGHRRAAWHRQDGRWSGHWLAP